MHDVEYISVMRFVDVNIEHNVYFDFINQIKKFLIM